MSTEFRRDPLTRRWIITGFAQGEQLSDLLPPSEEKEAGAECPFCEGHEHLTPAEVYAIRKNGSAPNSPGWEIRVVPNRSTDLKICELQKRGQTGIYDLQNASGVHETLIETPQHISLFSQLSVPQITTILKTFQFRNGEHKKNHLLKGILIFKNQGRGNAGLYEHTHSQLISFPFVPKTILDELSGAKQYYEMKMRCIFCDVLTEEKKLNLRIVAENNHYLAFCPFAARFPFETWILPKKHDAEFLVADPQTFSELALLLRELFGKIEKIFGNVPVSFILHTAPLRTDNPEEAGAIAFSYHWHIEILPHPKPAGAFEWGGDFFLSPLAPESCAKILSGKE